MSVKLLQLTFLKFQEVLMYGFSILCCWVRVILAITGLCPYPGSSSMMRFVFTLMSLGTSSRSRVVWAPLKWRYVVPPRQVFAHFYGWFPNRRIHKRWCWHPLWTFLLLHTTRIIFDCLWCRNWNYMYYTMPAELIPGQIWKSCYLSDSKAAILSAGSTETKISTETRDCQDLTWQLKANHKQNALQWIPGNCQITGNEQTDALAKKGTKITQTHIRETSCHFIKLHLRQVLKSVYRHQLETRLSHKLWKQEIAKIPDWPRRKAVA